MEGLKCNRRGSALLVVLGMLSFMVVSAVAFSAYMRYARLPSSYLRQTVASRLLVKAALAKAIDEIDAAIGDNPHPGIGTQQYNFPRRESSVDNGENRVMANRNWWLGRVYMGAGTNGITFVNQHETISPLCMEALAYIPPPLVNEARYYSRHSSAAKWHPLGYDIGRYSFCAIDVSDYFDLNAVHADIARSSATDARISLAYMFENDDHTSQSGSLGTPASWDAFMNNFREGTRNTEALNPLNGGSTGGGSSATASKLPLTSMADWNLAINNYRPSGWFSPFCEYVLNGSRNFYNLTDITGTRAETIRRMTFVTDGWYPERTVSDELDLSTQQGQPFTSGELDRENPNYYQITESGSTGAQRLLQYVPNIALAALYDYLDEDRVPLSLSIPTTERVAMICGIDVDIGGATLTLTKTKNPNSNGDDTFTPNKGEGVSSVEAEREYVYSFDANSFFGGMPTVKALVTYPFRHQDGVPANFTVDGGIAFFLTTEEMGLRPGSLVDRLKFTSDSMFSTGTIGDGVILVPFASKNVSFANDMNSAQDAVKELNMVADPASVMNLFTSANNVFLQLKYKWTQQDTSLANDKPAWTAGYVDKADPTMDDVQSASCGLIPLTSAGVLDNSFKSGGRAMVAALGNGVNLRLNVAVFLRIKLNNKTVDMVPACVENDKINGSSNFEAPESQVLLADNFGAMNPLMRFNTGATMALTLQQDGRLQTPSPAQVQISPRAVMVGDPRHNHAPESWFNADNCGGVSVANWLDKNHAKENDGDIFMQVSDQEYLQSIYELANIPRFGNRGFGEYGSDERGALDAPSMTDTIYRERGNEINHGFMWRTYDPFGRYGDYNGCIGDGFEALKIVNGGDGYKINPYSDNTNIIMAVFANTPHDWRCASVNNQEVEFENMTASQFNSQYAWNQYSNGAKLYWEDLTDFAQAYMKSVRNSNYLSLGWEAAFKRVAMDENGNFTTAYTENGWYANGADNLEDELCGIPLQGEAKLYNTDKKFLYGYWHDCFDIKQQLFLVFVRAEPTMMGGGAANQTPPQLGARAVALVWRDPLSVAQKKQVGAEKYKNPDVSGYKDGDNVSPHQTRILFYRQFD